MARDSRRSAAARISTTPSSIFRGRLRVGVWAIRMGFMAGTQPYGNPLRNYAASRKTVENPRAISIIAVTTQDFAQKPNQSGLRGTMLRTPGGSCRSFAYRAERPGNSVRPRTPHRMTARLADGFHRQRTTDSGAESERGRTLFGFGPSFEADDQEGRREAGTISPTGIPADRNTHNFSSKLPGEG